MSKRYVVCIPDSYIEMVEQFMAAQAHKGLSFAVLCSMAAKAYGMNDIIAPAIAGATLSPQRKDIAYATGAVSNLNQNTEGDNVPKKRGRPRKEQKTEVFTPVKEEVQPTVTPKPVLEPKAEEKVEAPASNITPNIKTEEPSVYIEDTLGVRNQNGSTFTPSKDDAMKDHRGWKDDAFDGIDPDFNPDGGLDNIAELFGR